MQLYKDGKPFGSPIEFAEDGNVNFNLSDTLNDKDAHTYFAVFQPAGTPASAPPWRVRLAGNEADLTDLASSLQGGDIRVVQDGKWYCLESEVLNQLTDPIVFILGR